MADDRADRHTNYGKLNGAKPSAGKTVAGFLLSSKTTMASWLASRREHLTMEACPDIKGELNEIYLLQRLQRQGLGRLLLCAVPGWFVERGVTSMLLFGEASNPSNGFYEALGAERLYSDKGEFHGGYGWRDLGPLVERCRK
ncbi:MAG TPA: GNAT family N-acetyltransferase [Blastocatellia bacterium]|nr:GNAT family N-acetyltransferase [Blastocatellia bacterium]